MRRSHFAFALLVALLVLMLSQVASARTMKQFRPGDLRVCDVRRCIAIRSLRVLDAYNNFYFGRPLPRRVAGPKQGSLYLRLVHRDGFVAGIAAGSRFTRFLSFGVNLGRFAARRWYTVPAPVAAEVRRLASQLSPGKLTRKILARSNY